jgi:hypothetical protein
MKLPFIIAICVIAILVIVVGVLPICLSEECVWQRLVENAGVSLATLTALLAVVIALSGAYPKRDRVKAVVEKPYVTRKIKHWKTTYRKDELTGTAAEFFADSCRSNHLLQSPI